MTARYSCTVLIETDGDPDVVVKALAESFAIAVQHRAYVGPAAVLRFSPTLQDSKAV